MICSRNLTTPLLRNGIYSNCGKMHSTRFAVPSKRTLRMPAMAKISNDLMPTKNYDKLAEKLNGRLAMLGFVSGSGYELVSGMNYLDQLKDTWPYAICLIGIVTFATLKTRNLEVIEERPFTTGLELLNGRMAMFGLLCKFINDSNILSL